LPDDNMIPLRVAAALAYGRLVERGKPVSSRELNEQLELMTTILAAAIPLPHRRDGQVSVAALFEAIERLRRDGSVHSSEMMPR
jgi:hypothetical protein